MTCANPIAWATLVDYWAGDLNDAETAARRRAPVRLRRLHAPPRRASRR